MDVYEISSLSKTEEVKRTTMGLIPKTGQFPFILLCQVRARLHFDVTWGDFQVAFRELYQELKIYPEQEFSQSIIRRAFAY